MVDEPLLPKSSFRSLESPNKRISVEFLERIALATQPINRLDPTSSIINLLANFNPQKNLIHRSNSAPCIITTAKEAFYGSLDPKLSKSSTPSIVKQALIALFLYVIMGITIYLSVGESFEDTTTTTKLVDALYYTVVTLCTIGYGDIVPKTNFAKILTCCFILVGFGFIDVLLNGLVTYVLDRQEAVLLSAVDRNRFHIAFQKYMFDTKKGRMRIRIKVGLALGVVVFCIAIGTVTVHFLESVSWVDSFYLSVMSVTTVGYGDYAFRTLKGRCFAIIWLLVSTLAVARAFLYLMELRIDKRNRRVGKWVLQKKMTVGDLVAADLDHDGSISKSDYIIYKLKELGKIADKDIVSICKQFDILDSANCGRLTISDIMASEVEDPELIVQSNDESRDKT